MKKNYILQDIIAKMNAMSKGSVPKDSDGYYQLPKDKNGFGSAIIRLLPSPADEDTPVVKLFNHAFKTPSGSWFIDFCPTTADLPCPVCRANQALWNGPDKNLALLRKRKQNYISNVLVVADPAKRENEGKVFLLKFGETIMGKIKDAMTPPFGDTEPFDPFDAESGANLRIRMTYDGNFPNYDKSSFDPPSPIGDEDAIAAVLNQRRSLSAIIAPNQFKSYEELKRKFDESVGGSKAA